MFRFNFIAAEYFVNGIKIQFHLTRSGSSSAPQPSARRSQLSEPAAAARSSISREEMERQDGDGNTSFALTPIIQEEDMENTGRIKESRSIQQVPDAAQGVSSQAQNKVYVQTTCEFFFVAVSFCINVSKSVCGNNLLVQTGGGVAGNLHFHMNRVLNSSQKSARS